MSNCMPSILIGTLRIGCSSTMAQNVLAGLTAKMLKEYPGLSVNRMLPDLAPDLIADGLDVAIRVGALQVFQPVFPPSWRCDGGVRREKLSHTIRHTGKTRRFK